MDGPKSNLVKNINRISRTGYLISPSGIIMQPVNQPIKTKKKIRTSNTYKGTGSTSSIEYMSAIVASTMHSIPGSNGTPMDLVY